MSEWKHTFEGGGSSDDCGYLDGATRNGQPVDEYDGCHNWFELKLDGKVIGQCMMDYNGGWSFCFRSNTHRLEAGELVCRWDDSLPQPPEEE